MDVIFFILLCLGFWFWLFLSDWRLPWMADMYWFSRTLGHDPIGSYRMFVR